MTLTNEVLIFHGGTAILPNGLLEDAQVECRDGMITSITSGTVASCDNRLPNNAELIELRGGYIVPGFVDIHVHGAGGADFMDGTVDAVRTACRAHARHGTTTLFPTTTTGTSEEIMQMIAACSEAQSNWTAADGSAIGGVHLYGPFFAKDKTGCHSAEVCRDPTVEETNRYFKTGMIKIATCAAELPGAAAFYRRARRRGCLITCGHSNASWTEMDRAFKAGMRHVDHFWCAMSSVSSIRSRLGVPMQGSMLEYVLSNPEMSTEVIADGCHLAGELLQFAWKMKTASKLCLVTDSNRAVDCPAGKYRFGSSKTGTWFESDGQVGWASKGSLASSVRGMDHMVRTMHRMTTVPLHDIVRMASLTPAERAGVAHQIGSLEVGKRADIIVLNRRLAVKHVFLSGKRFTTSG